LLVESATPVDKHHVCTDLRQHPSKPRRSGAPNTNVEPRTSNAEPKVNTNEEARTEQGERDERRMTKRDDDCRR
jgi:hypothetical protein